MPAPQCWHERCPAALALSCPLCLASTALHSHLLPWLRASLPESCPVLQSALPASLPLQHAEGQCWETPASPQCEPCRGCTLHASQCVETCVKCVIIAGSK